MYVGSYDKNSFMDNNRKTVDGDANQTHIKINNVSFYGSVINEARQILSFK